MTDFDLDEIAQLWRNGPPPEDEKVLQTLARRASWWGRLGDRLDWGFALLLGSALIVAILTQPTQATLTVGAILVGALIWASWKRHRLARAALMLDTSDREMLLATAVSAAKARLRRSLIAILGMLPVFVGAASLKYSYVHGSLDGFWPVFLSNFDHLGWGSVALVFVLAMELYLLRFHLILRRELRALRKLQEEYRVESRLDLMAGNPV